MRSSYIGRFSIVIVIMAAAGCQKASPPSSVPLPASQPINSTIACERSCSDGYDSCLDAPQVAAGGVRAGGHSDAAPVLDPKEICLDQLKACLRQCLN
jgi:hypothetical protein